MNELNIDKLLTIDEILSFDYEDDGLSGAKSFLKKLGIVALGAAGAIAAPFTGGLSLAAAATLTSAIGAGGAIASGLLSGTGGGGGGGASAKNQPSGIPEAIAAFDSEVNNIISQIQTADLDVVEGGRVDQRRIALHTAINQLWTVKHQSEQPKADAYHQQVDAVQDKWNRARQNEIDRRKLLPGNTAANNPASASNVPVVTTMINGQQVSGQVINNQFVPLNANNISASDNLLFGYDKTTVALAGISAVAAYLLLFKN